MAWRRLQHADHHSQTPDALSGLLARLNRQRIAAAEVDGIAEFPEHRNQRHLSLGAGHDGSSQRQAHRPHSGAAEGLSPSLRRFQLGSHQVGRRKR
jgi:hypothetical protein